MRPAAADMGVSHYRHRHEELRGVPHVCVQSTVAVCVSRRRGGSRRRRGWMGNSCRGRVPRMTGKRLVCRGCPRRYAHFLIHTHTHAHIARCVCGASARSVNRNTKAAPTDVPTVGVKASKDKWTTDDPSRAPQVPTGTVIPTMACRRCGGWSLPSPSATVRCQRLSPNYHSIGPAASHTAVSPTRPSCHARVDSCFCLAGGRYG